MDVTDFITQLLSLLAAVQQIQSVTYAIEGPVVDGNAIIAQDMFLRFYYNAVTGTTAFALIQNRQRIWGLDFDNRRSWHMHPYNAPQRHVPIEPRTLQQIMDELQEVLLKLP